jgi:hypothetical protein
LDRFGVFGFRPDHWTSPLHRLVIWAADGPTKQKHSASLPTTRQQVYANERCAARHGGNEDGSRFTFHRHVSADVSVGASFSYFQGAAHLNNWTGPWGSLSDIPMNLFSFASAALIFIRLTAFYAQSVELKIWKFGGNSILENSSRDAKV